MKTFLVWNPKSGKEKTPEEEQMLADHLDQLSPRSVGRTVKAGEAKRLAREAVQEGVQTIIVAGGDGTLGEVIDGLGEDLGRVRLGILPTGTGNDFARSLGIGPGIDQAIEVIARGNTRRIDAIRAENIKGRKRYFVNVCTSGFHEKTARERIESAFKGYWGPFGYIAAAIETAAQLENFRIKLTIMDEPPMDLCGSVIVVANAAYMSAGIPVAPEASISDGKFDLIIFQPTSTSELLSLVPWVMTGTHLECEDVFHRSATRVVIETEPETGFSIDDDTLSGGKITFSVMPRTLEVYVP